MTIEFGGSTHELPRGVVIGCIGARDSGISELLRQITAPTIGALDPFSLPSAQVIGIEYTLDLMDALRRARAEAEIDKLRRSGSTFVLASNDRALLRDIADEVWWIADGAVRGKGHPAEVLRQYEQHVAEEFRRSAEGARAEMAPSMRRGDGRAQIITLETLDGEGTPTNVWRSGEPVAVRVLVQFLAPVADPVVGIMIRTRIGMEVYGTNTELENVKVGPCAADETRRITFAFNCALCPQAYTLTAASHDPNGVWHDWLEDAVSFTVTDARYTAGVANLRATVTCSRE